MGEGRMRCTRREREGRRRSEGRERSRMGVRGEGAKTTKLVWLGFQGKKQQRAWEWEEGRTGGTWKKKMTPETPEIKDTTNPLDRKRKIVLRK